MDLTCGAGRLYFLANSLCPSWFGSTTMLGLQDIHAAHYRKMAECDSIVKNGIMGGHLTCSLYGYGIDIKAQTGNLSRVGW